MQHLGIGAHFPRNCVFYGNFELVYFPCDRVQAAHPVYGIFGKPTFPSPDMANPYGTNPFFQS